PDSMAALEDSPPALEVDPGLEPPILVVRGVLELPRGPRPARGVVELQVRVDEKGAVSEVAWTGGSSDTALVGAARRCALGMRFEPAQRGGRPVAVWCEQRFDFGTGAR
ncbi:MAG TPA: energy transducer TonB, partial [Terriglobales bacterium]|nr:energy transducer TonB [Terriglobales bacterium]